MNNSCFKSQLTTRVKFKEKLNLMWELIIERNSGSELESIQLWLESYEGLVRRKMKVYFSFPKESCFFWLERHGGVKKMFVMQNHGKLCSIDSRPASGTMMFFFFFCRNAPKAEKLREFFSV